MLCKSWSVPQKIFSVKHQQHIRKHTRCRATVHNPEMLSWSGSHIVLMEKTREPTRACFSHVAMATLLLIVVISLPSPLETGSTKRTVVGKHLACFRVQIRSHQLNDGAVGNLVCVSLKRHPDESPPVWYKKVHQPLLRLYLEGWKTESTPRINRDKRQQTLRYSVSSLCWHVLVQRLVALWHQDTETFEDLSEHSQLVELALVYLYCSTLVRFCWFCADCPCIKWN